MQCTNRSSTRTTKHFYAVFFSLVKSVVFSLPRGVNLPLCYRFCEFCKNIRTRTRDFCELCRTLIPILGACMSFVRSRHNTRHICEFCNTSIPVRGISSVRRLNLGVEFGHSAKCTSLPAGQRAKSYVRLLYPFPESTNPTEHILAIVLGQTLSIRI